MEPKPKLGRNQLIAIAGTGVPIVLGFALVLLGKLPADRWLEFSSTLASTGVGASVGGSALIKAVEAFRTAK